MSYEMQSAKQVGSTPFNHSQSSEAEAEYDRLRSLAREEASKRASCLERSQQAYQRGDGATAHNLSEEGKKHGSKMEQYNKQASEFIFRENNAPSRVPADTIDLHGQFVEEAEDILEERIKYAQSTGQTHLHVIVGKGNHSAGHVQKIKPRVEQVCRQLGLQYHTEPNEGRIYVNLQGGAVDMDHVQGWQGYEQAGYGGAYNQGQQHQQHQQQQYQPSHQQQQQQQQQQYGNNDDIEKLAKKFLPRILRFLKKLLCS